MSSIILLRSSPFTSLANFRSSRQNINLDSSCQACWIFSSSDEAAEMMLDKTLGLI